MRVALLGFGLIGGSIARALAASGGDWPVTGWSPSGDGPREALAEGLLEAAPSSAAAAIAGADLVVLAGPPTACLDLLDALGTRDRPALASDAVVTDVASTKALVVARAASHGLRFVGGHPMAGRERSGFGAADGDLFRDRPWVVVPPADDDEALARVEALARACGAIPVPMAAPAHDAAVAGISHLPLVLAAALVEAVVGGPSEAEAPGWRPAAALAASGWASATRLARGDPTMGAGIAATNAAPLAERIRAVRDRLDEWLALLEASPGAGGPDEAALRARLAAARERLRDADG